MTTHAERLAVVHQVTRCACAERVRRANHADLLGRAERCGNSGGAGNGSCMKAAAGKRKQTETARTSANTCNHIERTRPHASDVYDHKNLGATVALVYLHRAVRDRLNLSVWVARTH